MTLPTSREARTAMDQALAKLRDGTLTAPINFVLGGQALSVDEPALAAMVAAIAKHVQASYDVQAQALADIAAGTITTEAEIDALPWPA